ncbi:MAG: hypothetical protein JRJ85_15565 [Deltaproteobacteria bacterium]|nr:hypothetical protein [Deltaproteobacteria bacterium]
MENHGVYRDLTNGSYPFLILPIETKVREFHAKLLLSCFAAEAGFRIIFGDQNEIIKNLKSLPRGIYIDKGVAGTKVKNFRRNHKLGNRVVAWCEEGLTFRHPESYLKERISIEAFDLVQRFFAWGSHQDHIIREKINHDEDNKIICSGNPRFDLLQPVFRQIFLPDAKTIQDHHGRFILINTNFSRFNHYYGREFVIKNLKERGRIRNEKDEAFFRAWSD